MTSPSLDVSVPAASRRPSRARMIGFRAALVFAAVLPLLWGVSSLVSAIDGGSHLVHDLLGAGVLLSAIWVAPLAAMWQPGRVPSSLPGYLAFVLAAVLAAALSASNAGVAVVLVVQATLVTVLHPARHASLARRVGLSPLLLPLALLASGGLATYAVAEAALQATGDSHAVLAHYFDQAWVALGIGLFALLAALREDARRFAGRIGAAGLMSLGGVSFLFPEVSSSVGIVWGVIAFLTGLAFLAVAESEARHTVASAGMVEEAPLG
jgi:hypothetical protein